MHSTKTHSVSSAKIAVAVSFMFVAGAAAFAAAAIPRQLKGYNSVSVVCADGSSMQIRPGLSIVNGKRAERPTTCLRDAEWRQRALNFCEGKVSRNGSRRMRSLRISGVCRIDATRPLSPPFSAPRPPAPPAYGYGYNPIPPGYGYGYNPIPPGYGYGYNPANIRPTYSALTVIPPSIVLNKGDVIELHAMGLQNGTQFVPALGGLMWENVDQLGTVLSADGNVLRLRVDHDQGKRQLRVTYGNPGPNEPLIVSAVVDLDIQ